jgi:hypothetical protein
LKKYESRFEELKRNVEIKTRQISKLHAQNVTLLNMASTGSESATNSQRLGDLLNAERSKNSVLMAKINELEDSLASSGKNLSFKNVPKLNLNDHSAIFIPRTPYIRVF